MADGETRRIEWPTTRFMVASPPGTERDVVLIRGIEPSMRWRTFCEQVLEVCHSLEVNRVVLLGALLADVPYTRPLPISGSASDTDAAERYQLTPTRYEGPTGIVGVLHDACPRAEVDAVSFWVHVPHYANNPPCPKATLALLHRVEEVLDLPVPMADLAEEAGGVGAAGARRRRAGRRARRVRARAGGARRRRRHPAADRRRDRPASSRSTCAAAAARPAPPPAPGSAAPQPSNARLRRGRRRVSASSWRARCSTPVRHPRNLT